MKTSAVSVAVVVAFVVLCIGQAHGQINRDISCPDVGCGRCMTEDEDCVYCISDRRCYDHTLVDTEVCDNSTWILYHHDCCWWIDIQWRPVQCHQEFLIAFILIIVSLAPVECVYLSSRRLVTKPWKYVIAENLDVFTHDAIREEKVCPTCGVVVNDLYGSQVEWQKVCKGCNSVRRIQLLVFLSIATYIASVFFFMVGSMPVFTLIVVAVCDVLLGLTAFFLSSGDIRPYIFGSNQAQLLAVDSEDDEVDEEDLAPLQRVSQRIRKTVTSALVPGEKVLWADEPAFSTTFSHAKSDFIFPLSILLLSLGSIFITMGERIPALVILLIFFELVVLIPFVVDTTLALTTSTILTNKRIIKAQRNLRFNTITHSIDYRVLETAMLIPFRNGAPKGRVVFSGYLKTQWFIKYVPDIYEFQSVLVAASRNREGPRPQVEFAPTGNLPQAGGVVRRSGSVSEESGGEDRWGDGGANKKTESPKKNSGSKSGSGDGGRRASQSGSGAGAAAADQVEIRLDSDDEAELDGGFHADGLTPYQRRMEELSTANRKMYSHLGFLFAGLCLSVPLFIAFFINTRFHPNLLIDALGAVFMLWSIFIIAFIGFDENRTRVAAINSDTLRWVKLVDGASLLPVHVQPSETEGRARTRSASPTRDARRSRSRDDDEDSIEQSADGRRNLARRDSERDAESDGGGSSSMSGSGGRGAAAARAQPAKTTASDKKTGEKEVPTASATASVSVSAEPASTPAPAETAAEASLVGGGDDDE